jgi:hypothetical protein
VERLGETRTERVREAFTRQTTTFEDQELNVRVGVAGVESPREPSHLRLPGQGQVVRWPDAFDLLTTGLRG